MGALGAARQIYGVTQMRDIEKRTFVTVARRFNGN